MDLKDLLARETKKQIEKIEKVRIFSTSEKADEYITNIRAYIEDSKHFLKEGKLIEAFEAIIWAWAWLEILKELGYIQYSTYG